MSADQVEFELKLTFLERSIEACGEVMITQARQITELEQRLERLERKLESQDAPDVGPHDSPPPHY